MFNPNAHLPGGFSQSDGTLDFYSRVNALINSDMVVVDLGAGRASWYEDEKIHYKRELRLLKGKVKKLIATDIDPIVLENGSADECLIMEAGRIPLPDSTADMIVADYVLEHVDDEDAFSAEINRVLKPGGWFCARTPHKFNYVSIIASLVKNKSHGAVISKVQPGRKEIDVFPTRYRLNKISDVKAAFSGYENKTFLYKSEPSYYFGRKWIYSLLKVAHHILPKPFYGNLFVFVKKPG